MSELSNERTSKKSSRLSRKRKGNDSSLAEEDVQGSEKRESEIAEKRPRPEKKVCLSERSKISVAKKNSLSKRTAWSESDKYSVKRRKVHGSLWSLEPRISDWIDKNTTNSASIQSSDSVIVADKECQKIPEYITKLASHERLSRYDLSVLLGNGSFGDVIAATRKIDNLPVAIKFVQRKSVREFKVLNGRKMPTEAYLQRRACHRHVIQLYEIFPTETHYVFVLERPERCTDLFEILQSEGVLSEKKAMRYFFQIVEANLHCEEHGVIHRDLKPENIVVDLGTDEAKLIDFGLASEMHNKPFKKFRGTNEYCPPEYLTSGLYDGSQATVWQLGILLVEILSPYMAFEKPSDALTKPPNVPGYLSPEVKNLISSLLNSTPENRPTLREVLRHPWFWMEK